MTCIVGLETPKGVIIGGDSAGTNRMFAQSIRADQKVWSSGEFIYGFTSSFRMGQLLRYKLTPSRCPYPQADQDEMDRYMTTDYLDCVRKALKEGGYAKVENGVEQGGTFLVGWRGSLYCIQSDFQVARSVDGFDAVGSGADLALGALHATPELKPKDRVKLALEAAAKYNAAVAGPFHIEEGAGRV